MFELKKTAEAVKSRLNRAADAVLSHRRLYGGLALFYGVEAFVAAQPAQYAPVAALYALLAWRG